MNIFIPNFPAKHKTPRQQSHGNPGVSTKGEASRPTVLQRPDDSLSCSKVLTKGQTWGRLGPARF